MLIYIMWFSLRFCTLSDGKRNYNNVLSNSGNLPGGGVHDNMGYVVMGASSSVQHTLLALCCLSIHPWKIDGSMYYLAVATVSKTPASILGVGRLEGA